MASKVLKMKKKKIISWNSDKILSISAIFISIGTFLVFAYQTNLIRKQQLMSVYPHLQFIDYHNYSKNYKFVLKNKGIGPALVTLVNISIKGKKENKDLAFYLGEKINPVRDTISFETSSIYKGLIISEKESVDLVKILWTNNRKNAKKLFDLIHNDSLDFIIEYRSIYGEKWRVSIKNSIPVKID